MDDKLFNEKLPNITSNINRNLFLFKIKRKEIKNKNLKSKSIYDDNQMIMPKLKEHYLILQRSQSNFSGSLINDINYIKNQINKKKLHNSSSLDFEKELNKIKFHTPIKKNQYEEINKDIDNKLKKSFVNSFFDEKNLSKNFFTPNIKIQHLKENLNNTNNKIESITPKKSLNKNYEYDNNIIFTKMIIEDYLIKKKNEENENRTIFIILNGTVILSTLDIKGIFVEIPKKENLLKIPKNIRNKLMEAFMKKCSELFSRKLLYIFSSEHKLILDLIELNEDEKFIIVSKTFYCSGIILIPTEKFKYLYIKEFPKYYKEYLKKKKKKVNTIDFKKSEPIIKINKKYYGMKQKYKIDKLNNSFANGENEIEQIEYEMYSDDEEKKKMILKKIKRHCVLKHDFFLYLNDESTEKKILKLKKQLKYTNPVDIEKEYREFKCDNNKLYERFKKENNLNQTMNIFNTNKKVTIKEIINNIKIHNLQFPNDKWENVFFHKKKYKSAEKKNSFYYNIDKNVNKYYSHLIGYNIPKILKEFKKYSRKDLYKTFTLYKNLITLCYGLNKSKIILENGIDFQTFWRCVNEISTEKSKFVEKLFKEINSKKSSLLSMKDFFNGMYYIQNTDIKEKIDLFLRAIDESGKGVLNYNEVVSICKDAIKRNLSDDINLNGEIALEDLSIFFAGLIFKLLNHEKNELISMEDIKKGIVEGSIESQYLEMFCGT